MEITAFDDGIDNRKSGKTHVNITILDVNNKPPTFKQLSLKDMFILEGNEPGEYITTLAAEDPDSDALLKYKIQANKSQAFDENGNPLTGLNVTDIVAMDENTGDLFVMAELDRETLAHIRIGVSVEDMMANQVASKFQAQMSEAVLDLQVQDVNDNDPVFDHEFYLVNLLENVPADTPIVTVHARDLDQNRTIVYNLEGSLDILQILDIEPFSGKVLVRQKIDYEDIKWLNFTVRAMDNGVPSRSSYADVSVAVQDDNDNSPKFTQSSTNITVREDTQPGTIVAKLHALDNDSGEFGRVTYFLDRASAIGRFKIDPDTGELSVGTEALDREFQDKYNLLVEAYDNYHFGFPIGESRHAFTQVSVQVTDVNDETPVFEDDDQGPQGCSVITEFHNINEPILTVRAKDADDPRTPNGQVKFNIQDGNEQKLFKMEPNGRLYPAKELKGYYGNFSVTILASDLGHPSNSASKTFAICIQDFNDNAPKFITPPRNFTLRVPENTTIGEDVLTVQAIDTDIGSNGAVRYRIRKDPLGNYRSFSIDPVSGVVTLIQPLDRERQKMYEIRIEAYDLGVPTSLQSDLDINIYVRNVNDHEPQFLVDEVRVNFTEHKAPGAERVKLAKTVDRDDVDEEERKMLDVCYFIVSSDGPTGLFALHPTSHDLMVNKELDREVRSEYILVVKATEECINPLDESKDNNVTMDFNDDTLLMVKVSVNDIDDNAPQFAKKIFTGGIATDNDYGSVIMTVHASDPDVDAVLEYSVIGSIVSSKESEGLQDMNKEPFLLDKTSGDIVLNFDPQKGMKGYFAFHVKVEDMAGHSDRATVQIYLLREDQRVKFVVRSHPSEIRSKMDDFRSILASVTGSIVNVDHFVVHEDDHTKTDVLLHFVNPHDNTVLEANEVLKIIDYRTEELDPVFKEFNVLHTEGVNPSYVKAMSQETVIIMWLVGINIFQIILLILVLTLCYNQRTKYKRQVKAAMTAASVTGTLNRPGSRSPNGLKMGPPKDFVPNTNKHAGEGSNPVWMTSVAYDNMTFLGDQDHDMDDDQIDDNVLQHAQDALDSLDANILNAEFNDHHQETGSGKIHQSDEDQGCYADASFSAGDGSTIRVGSSITKMLLEESGSPNATLQNGRSQPQSRSSESSGLGSGSSR